MKGTTRVKEIGTAGLAVRHQSQTPEAGLQSGMVATKAH